MFRHMCINIQGHNPPYVVEEVNFPPHPSLKLSFYELKSIQISNIMFSTALVSISNICLNAKTLSFSGHQIITF